MAYVVIRFPSGNYMAPDFSRTADADLAAVFDDADKAFAPPTDATLVPVTDLAAKVARAASKR